MGCKVMGGEVHTVISQPVAKVNTGNAHFIKLLASRSAGHGKEEEGIFDIAMTPWYS